MLGRQQHSRKPWEKEKYYHNRDPDSLTLHHYCKTGEPEKPKNDVNFGICFEHQTGYSSIKMKL